MPVSLSSLLKGSLQARLSGKIMWRVYSEASPRTPKREQAGDLHLCQSKEGFFLCSPSVQLSTPFHKYSCSPELAPNLICFSFGSIILGGLSKAGRPLSLQQAEATPASFCLCEKGGVTSTAVPHASLERIALTIAPPPLLPFVSDSV